MNKLDLKAKMPDIKKKKAGKSNIKKPMGAHQTAKYILIVGVIIILIPCAALGIILITASTGTDKPAEGHRFKGDLNPEISNDNLKTIESNIASISGVEKAEVNLSTGQLTVYVDVNDTMNSSDVKKVAVDTYKAVGNTLDVATYFTSTTSKRMYDLSINVYNFIPDDNATDYVCWNVQKNGQMDAESYLEISKAQDEELAKELRGETTAEE